MRRINLICKIICCYRYSLLEYPPTSFVNNTFIGAANNSSFLNALPSSLKSLLTPCACSEALSLYLSPLISTNLNPVRKEMRKRRVMHPDLRFEHHDSWRVALRFSVDLIAQCSGFISLNSSRRGYEKLFYLDGCECCR